MVHRKAKHGHGAARLQHPVAFAAIVHHFLFQEVREQRGRKDEIRARILQGKFVVSAGSPFCVIGFAAMLGAMEFEARAIEIRAAPIQHFFVDINSNVFSGECFILELIVSQWMGKSPAAAANVHNRGIKPEQARMKGVGPEIPGLVQVKYLVCEEAVPNAHSDTHVIGWNSREFLEHAVRQ